MSQSNSPSSVLTRLEALLDGYTDAVHEHRKLARQPDYKTCVACQAKRRILLDAIDTALSSIKGAPRP